MTLCYFPDDIFRDRLGALPSSVVLKDTAGRFALNTRRYCMGHAPAYAGPDKPVDTGICRYMKDHKTFCGGLSYISHYPRGETRDFYRKL